MNMKHIAHARILAGILLAFALTGFLAADEALELQPAAAVNLSGFWQMEMRGIQSDSNSANPIPFSEIAYMMLFQEGDGGLYGSIYWGDEGGAILLKAGAGEPQDPMGITGIRMMGLVTASRFWLMGQGYTYPDLDPFQPNDVVIIVDDFMYHAIMAWGVTGFDDMLVGKFHYMIFEGIPGKNSIGTENYTGIMGTFRAYKIADIDDELR